jgi:hypothetical protein
MLCEICEEKDGIIENTLEHVVVFSCELCSGENSGLIWLNLIKKLKRISKKKYNNILRNLISDDSDTKEMIV